MRKLDLLKCTSDLTRGTGCQTCPFLYAKPLPIPEVQVHLVWWILNNLSIPLYCYVNFVKTCRSLSCFASIVSLSIILILLLPCNDESSHNFTNVHFPEQRLLGGCPNFTRRHLTYDFLKPKSNGCSLLILTTQRHSAYLEVLKVLPNFPESPLRKVLQ